MGSSGSLSIMRYDPQDHALLGADTKRAIDKEVERLLRESYDRAKACLSHHRKDLETVAQGLLRYETLTGDEIHALLRGKKIRTGDANKAGVGSSSSGGSSGNRVANKKTSPTSGATTPAGAAAAPASAKSSHASR